MIFRDRFLAESASGSLGFGLAFVGIVGFALFVVAAGGLRVVGSWAALRIRARVVAIHISQGTVADIQILNYPSQLICVLNLYIRYLN